MVCCRKCSISAFCILAGLLLCVGGAAFTTGLDSIPTATRQRMRRRGPSDYHPLHALESVEEPTVTQTSSQSKAVNARSVAAHALLEKKGQPSLQRLESDPLFKSLEDQRNRSFARLLVTTVERRLGQIDAVLKQCQSSNHKSKKKVCVVSRLRLELDRMKRLTNHYSSLIIHRSREYGGTTCMFKRVFESEQLSCSFWTFQPMQPSRKRLNVSDKTATSRCRKYIAAIL